MTTLREAAKQALTILEAWKHKGMWGDWDGVTDALKAALVEDAMQKFTDVNQELEAALAEPVQEPVANDDEVICPACCHQFRAIPPNVQQMMLDAGFEPPFTAPPQRKPLSEEEALDIARTFGAQPWPPGSCVAFARAIEAKHGIV